MKAAKPAPRIVTEVCTLCGLDWRLHGDEATTDDCIRLLAAEVRRLESALASRPHVYPLPYPQPYPVPYPAPWRPYWPNQWGGTIRPTITYSGNTISGHIPALSSSAPRAMLASG